MSVVNVKVAFIRPQYHNLKEWMSDPQNVYVARAGVVFIDGERFPKKSSKFANPFKIVKDGTREEVLEMYRDWLEQQIAEGIITQDDLESLRGKTLGCWCAPEPCHADVLREYIS